MRIDDGGGWMLWTDAGAALELKPAVVIKLIEDEVLPSEETSAGLVMVRRADVERLRALDPNSRRAAEPFERLALRLRMETGRR